ARPHGIREFDTQGFLGGADVRGLAEQGPDAGDHTGGIRTGGQGDEKPRKSSESLNHTGGARQRSPDTTAARLDRSSFPGVWGPGPQTGPRTLLRPYRLDRPPTGTRDRQLWPQGRVGIQDWRRATRP